MIGLLRTIGHADAVNYDRRLAVRCLLLGSMEYCSSLKEWSWLLKVIRRCARGKGRVAFVIEASSSWFVWVVGVAAQRAHIMYLRVRGSLWLSHSTHLANIHTCTLSSESGCHSPTALVHWCSTVPMGARYRCCGVCCLLLVSLLLLVMHMAAEEFM